MGDTQYLGEFISAYAWLLIAAGVWSALLCYFDWRFRKLPNALTLGGFIVVVVLLWCYHMLWALQGGALWFGVYLLLALVINRKNTQHIGGGDIKLALSLGCVLMCAAGEASRGMLVILLAIFWANIFTICAIIFSRLGQHHLYFCALSERDAHTAHGPWMLGATWLMSAWIFITGGVIWG